MAAPTEDGAIVPEKIEIKHNPKCYAIFRPHEKWKGEYGFDWVRFRDEQIKTINGKKGNDPATAASVWKSSYKNLQGTQWQIRLSEGNRATFTVDDKSQTVTMLAEGGHT